ncbi:MAG: hypothetical protein IJ783_06090, partial [Kiritimatiellae bacterium]|nr:hypothetical protein [Kiritimatiellia bacterium]
GDFVAVRAWLQELTDGQRPTASVRVMRDSDDARRARWSLRRTCASFARSYGGEDGALRYAGALLRDIHHTTWEDATARQLWAVAFTMRARRRGATRPGKPAERAGRRVVPENGQFAAPGAPRVFPRVSRAGIGHLRRSG